MSTKDNAENIRHHATMAAQYASFAGQLRSELGDPDAQNYAQAAQKEAKLAVEQMNADPEAATMAMRSMRPVGGGDHLYYTKVTLEAVANDKPYPDNLGYGYFRNDSGKVDQKAIDHLNALANYGGQLSAKDGVRYAENLEMRARAEQGAAPYETDGLQKKYDLRAAAVFAKHAEAARAGNVVDEQPVNASHAKDKEKSGGQHEHVNAAATAPELGYDLKVREFQGLALTNEHSAGLAKVLLGNTPKDGVAGKHVVATMKALGFDTAELKYDSHGVATNAAEVLHKQQDRLDVLAKGGDVFAEKGSPSAPLSPQDNKLAAALASGTEPNRVAEHLLASLSEDDRARLARKLKNVDITQLGDLAKTIIGSGPGAGGADQMKDVLTSAFTHIKVAETGPEHKVPQAVAATGGNSQLVRGG